MDDLSSRYLLYPAIAGAFAGLVFAALLLASDPALLATLASIAAEYAPILAGGLALALAPLFIVGALMMRQPKALPVRR